MSKIIRKILCVFSVFAITAAIFTGCASSNNSSSTGDTSSEASGEAEQVDVKDLPVLRAAIMPFLNSVPINYIADNKLDEKYGFKLETVLFTTGGPMNEAIASDLWDVGVMSTASVYSLSTYQAYLIADFGNSGGGTGIYVRPESDIAKASGYNPTYPDIMGSPDTVRGKQVIFQTGHVSQLTVLKWLEKIGVSADDVDTVNMEQSSAYLAFLAGEGDIAALAPPLSYNAEDQGWVCVADLDSLGVPQRESVIASPNAYKEKHELLVSFLKALFEANETLRNDPAMETQVLSDWYKENGSEVDLKIVQKEVETRLLLTAEEARNEELGAATRLNAEFFVDLGNIEASKLSIYDTNIVTDVLKEAIGYNR